MKVATVTIAKTVNLLLHLILIKNQFWELVTVFKDFIIKIFMITFQLSVLHPNVVLVIHHVKLAMNLKTQVFKKIKKKNLN